MMTDDADPVRPVRRGQCDGTEGPRVRPCPWFGCKYHLGLAHNIEPTETSPDGPNSLRLTGVQTVGPRDSKAKWLEASYQALERWDDPDCESCSLDVADRGPHSLRQVASFDGTCKERIRQVELIVNEKAANKHNPLDYVDGPTGPLTVERDSQGWKYEKQQRPDAP